METVDLWIVDSDGNPADDLLLLNSLHNSLSGNQYIRDNAELKLPEVPPEEMGPDVATIQLILYGGFELAKLALAFAEWRTRRHEAVGSVAVRANGRVSVLHPDDMKDPNDEELVVRSAFTQAPDPDRSACVLIGVSDYADLDPLPGVRENLHQLRGVLGDPEVWGIPESRFYQVDYTQSPDVILRKVSDAAAAASDTLLVYFAGHGLLREGELRLGLPEATEAGDHTLRWEDVASIIRRAGCRRKVIWLDCCHAGLAASRKRVGADEKTPSELFRSAKQEGTYLLAAVRKSGKAMSRHSSGCTAFTGELVSALRQGIALDSPQKFLSLNSLHQQLRTELSRMRLPEPVRHDPDDIGQLPHFHNKNKDQVDGGKGPVGPGGWRRREWQGFPVRRVASACAVVALVLAAWFVPGPDVSGLDLAKYCSSLAPGGAQNFEIADTSCVRPIDLDDACVYSYQTYGLDARLTSPDINSAQCFNSPTSSESRGGIPDMTGYCESRTRIAGVRATARNMRFPDTWVCQSDANLDAVCDSQNNRTDLTSREEDNGDLTCFKTHWF